LVSQQIVTPLCCLGDRRIPFVAQLVPWGAPTLLPVDIEQPPPPSLKVRALVM
jgi:hypothetical protein